MNLFLNIIIPSFVWLFNTLKIAVSEREPKTITDQSAAMKAAIEIALPSTCHWLSLWHIFINAVITIFPMLTILCPISRSSREAYMKVDMRRSSYLNGIPCLKNTTLTNEWLSNLFVLREKSALVYQRNSFFATMATSQISEIMNKHFKMFLRRNLSLAKLIKQYERSLYRFQEKELYEVFKSKQTMLVLFLHAPMLQQAAESYTTSCWILYKKYV